MKRSSALYETNLSGTNATESTLRRDVRRLFAKAIKDDVDPTTLKWVMHPDTALEIMCITIGRKKYPAFPYISVTGGAFMGLPVSTKIDVEKRVIKIVRK